MALTDLYNVVHDMTYLGQKMLNVYQCERANAGETAQTVNDAFQNSVLPSIRAFQNNGVVHNELRIFNLGVSTDFGTFTLGAATGQRAGTKFNAFVVGEVKFPSLNRAVRTGFKRYGGLVEADDTDGVLTGAVLTLLDTIGSALIGQWQASSDSHHVANFVIIKRVCATTPPVGDPCPQYRLPETGDPLVLYQPNSRIAITTLRSQVSRRPAAT